MSAVKWPLRAPLDMDHIPAEVSGGWVISTNVIEDSLGVIHKRPGLFLWDDSLPEYRGIDGLYHWRTKGLIIVIHNGNMWYTTDLLSPLTMISTDKLAIGPASFASNDYWLYVASTQGKMLKWDGDPANPATFENNPIAPQDVSHVGYLNGKMLANSRLTNQIWYSEPVDQANPTNPVDWSGYFQAERSPHYIQAFVVYNNQILVMKHSSCEFFFDDGTTPFQRVEGSAFNLGIGAAKSVTVTDNTVFWVTTDMAIVMLSQQQPTIISLPIQSYLRGMDSYTDAFTTYSGQYLILTFPTTGKTLIYDLLTKGWYEWATWSADRGDFEQWVGQHALTLTTGHQLIGGKDGQIYFLASEAFSDTEKPIRVVVRTPHVHHGETNYKRSNELRIQVSTQRRPAASDGLYHLTPEAFPDTLLVDLSDATRCSAYTHTFSLPTGYTVYKVTNLPTGLSYNSATQIISGTASCSIGTWDVGIYVRSPAGASKFFMRQLTITDIDVTVTVV